MDMPWKLEAKSTASHFIFLFHYCPSFISICSHGAVAVHKCRLDMSDAAEKGSSPVTLAGKPLPLAAGSLNGSTLLTPQNKCVLKHHCTGTLIKSSFLWI